MNKPIEIKVPDIGDFQDVEIIDVLVKPGDQIKKEDPLITLETDKATMDIPAPQPGTVKEVKVKTGDKVSEGSPILLLESADAETTDSTVEKPDPPASKQADKQQASTASTPAKRPEHGQRTEIAVLGAGPGGYTAAFRAADLGMQVTLIERYPTLGGVCLNVGCIPSKALLHVARVLAELEELGGHGIDLGSPRPDAGAVRQFSEDVVKRLTDGLARLAKQRGIEVVQGNGRFSSPHSIAVEIAGSGDTREFSFDQAIIAAGSRPAMLPDLPDDPRILDSTSALRLEPLPKRLLVVGGGIIGLEMATVYDALGSKVTVVEWTGSLMPGCDTDLIRVLSKRISTRYEAIYLQTKVTGVKAGKKELTVAFDGSKAPDNEVFDAVLIAVGRKPNGDRIAADRAGIRVDERGFIPVDDQMRTNVPHILAIGDIVGHPMLAHKASHEGKVAAEVAAGLKSGFEDRVIPSVAYTDPEIAWAGLTETEAKSGNIDYGIGTFPWAASGRSLTLGRGEGLTKLLFDPASQRILGIGIAGANAGDLIAEGVLAIELGADAQDLALTIHPHPTLSETIGFAAESYEGTITDLYLPKRKNNI